jgi:putative phosphoribosyl transferase
MRFRDRVEAGRRLADAVERADCADLEVVVLALPRGGVPVGAEVARALGAPLDVLVVRKLGVPFQPELAMGAIGEKGVRVANDDVLRIAGLGIPELDEAERTERLELERRAAKYRAGRPRIDLHGRCAVIVDDGIATGSTARAACQVARGLGASRVVLAVPVASRLAASELRAVCDELICLDQPDPFFAVGEWYRDFSQVGDDQVVELLHDTVAAPGPGDSDGEEPAERPLRDDDVKVRCPSARLDGHLTVPPEHKGLVIFAHGSGSSRLSPRNRVVATALNAAGLATLLVDLLSETEEQERANVFDVAKLSQRLGEVTTWALAEPALQQTTFGYFGASTGAAAALWAAAQPGCAVSAIVSRGGRPDLAGAQLAGVRAPTLLIVGGRDEQVLRLNRNAQADLHCENRLAVVPEATHLFEEPGALDEVAGLARDWFLAKLQTGNA